ncbi:MAG: PAS domain-containing protein [Gemmatimonadota bacterium]
MSFVQNAAWLDRLLGTISENVVVFDRSGRILYLNRSQHGTERSDVEGMDVRSFLQPEGREELARAIEAVFEHGEAQEGETEAVMPDGSTLWYRGRTYPLWEDGRVVAALVVSTDITEVKAAGERLANLHRLLPVCSWCDRIQTEDGQWQTLERYIKKTAHTEVTHGVCPDCYEREMGRLADGRTGTRSSTGCSPAGRIRPCGRGSTMGPRLARRRSGSAVRRPWRPFAG